MSLCDLTKRLAKGLSAVQRLSVGFAGEGVMKFRLVPAGGLLKQFREAEMRLGKLRMGFNELLIQSKSRGLVSGFHGARMRDGSGKCNPLALCRLAGEDRSAGVEASDVRGRNHKTCERSYRLTVKGDRLVHQDKGPPRDA
jgi:hypothetical protein